jgi:hypothetical protein
MVLLCSNKDDMMFSRHLPRPVYQRLSILGLVHLKVTDSGEAMLELAATDLQEYAQTEVFGDAT